MSENPYKLFAERLNALPNGFPPTEDGAELRLLEKFCAPDEAALAAKLRLTLETAEQIAERTSGDPVEVKELLRSMRRKGLVRVGKGDGGLAYGLLPFAIGIYENQAGSIDEEMARLFEDYYMQAFSRALTMKPSVHRVIPVDQSVQTGMEIQPYENVTEIIDNAKAWGVMDCICRNQKALIGDPCDHPLESCMIFSQKSGIFDGHSFIRALSHEEAIDTLQMVADAGLVHCVGNHQEDMVYICNCCTCSCGILRGMADLGLANVIAASAFVNQVDEDLCVGCEDCIEYCQFDALEMGGDVIQISETRCVGCGVCVPNCEDNALRLVRRPEEEVMLPPVTESDWMAHRAAILGLDLSEVM
jgi:Pyruvate/2-oxoacid:ferredoxin oxidoreductase delta subunit